MPKKISNLFKQSIEHYLLALLILLLFSFALFINYYYKFNEDRNVFSELAWSFLHGKLYFLHSFSGYDFIFLNGVNYWNMPPLPAIIAMPFVFIARMPLDQFFFTLGANIILAVLLFSFCYKKFNFPRINSLWLTIMYLFASVYISSMFFIGSYYYAQSLATIFILLGLYEFFGKKRYWLIGLLMGCVLLTRFTAFLCVFFYFLVIILEKNSLRKKIKNLVLLGVPILICLLLLLLYNYLRFGNFLENGYTLTNAYLNSAPPHPYGLFSLKYIPSNIYYYFLESFTPNLSFSALTLQSPYFLPNPYGAMSFFLISPLFLLVFKSNWKNIIIRYLLLTSVLILFILLCYYYNGLLQIGPRYFNDFLPLLFIVLLFKLQEIKFSYFHKFIICLSALLNIYLFIALFYLILPKS